MAEFCSEQWFEVITPSCCNVPFAMSLSHYRDQMRKKQSGGWWCPHCGQSRIFTGETKEQKLKRQLEQEQQRNQELEQQKHRVAAQNRRIRQRIKNGVCPCCNRTFSNLANHMATQHPDFGDERRLKTLRLAFGLTQADLEQETGVGTVYISRYENRKPVPEWAKDNIEWWLSQQSA